MLFVLGPKFHLRMQGLWGGSTKGTSYPGPSPRRGSQSRINEKTSAVTFLVLKNTHFRGPKVLKTFFRRTHLVLPDIIPVRGPALEAGGSASNPPLKVLQYSKFAEIYFTNIYFYLNITKLS